MLFGPISNQTIGGKDWLDSFRSCSSGDYSKVVTPFWCFFTSYLPSLLPEPYGYTLWITLGAVSILLTAHLFQSPLIAILLSYQLNWILFYGQIDPFIILGIGMGYTALKHDHPYVLGIALALLTIKPQMGALLALYFFSQAPHRMKTGAVFCAIVLGSLIIWPEWPIHLLEDHSQTFLLNPHNEGTNTALMLPISIRILIAFISLWLPGKMEQKIPLLLASTLFISPYSTIYSQLALLVVGLPPIFSLFGVIPWVPALLNGPFNGWPLGCLFPLSVIGYEIIQIIRRMIHSNPYGQDRGHLVE